MIMMMIIKILNLLIFFHLYSNIKFNKIYVKPDKFLYFFHYLIFKQ